jgi:hypothetical protein
MPGFAMTEDTPEWPPESPWGKLLTASTADAQPPAGLRDAILARVAVEQTAGSIASMPAPANDRGFRPWMGVAAMMAIVAFIGVASLSPNPENQRGAPVIAADAGPEPGGFAPLVLPIGPDGLTVADTTQVAAWAGQSALCGRRIRLSVPADPTGAKVAAAVQSIIEAKAGCPLPVDRTAGVNGLLELNAG